MRIEFIPIQDLLLQVHREGVCPISLERARAQMQNPNAVPSDPGLALALEGEKCLGYIGLLPGKLCYKGSFHKVFFTSTAYVPPNLRSTLAGLKLARAVVGSSLDLVGAANRDRGARLWKGVKGTQALPSLNVLRLKIPLKISLEENFRFKEVSQLRQDIPPPLPTCGFYRDIPTINWMLNYPWPSTETSSYYFNHAHWDIRYKALEIYESNTYVGFVVFKLSKQKKTGFMTLHILDYVLTRNHASDFILKLALVTAKNAGASYIEIGEELLFTSQNPLISLFVESIKERTYFIKSSSRNSPLAMASSYLGQNYCDGDTAFT